MQSSLHSAQQTCLSKCPKICFLHLSKMRPSANRVNLQKQVASPFLLRQFLGDTSFTLEWVLKALNANDPQWPEVLHGQTISKVEANLVFTGKGFASRLYKISLFIGNDSRNVYSVLLKHPALELFEKTMKEGNVPQDEIESVTEDSFQESNDIECSFYNLYKEKRIPLPTIYATQKAISGVQEGAILMEYIENGTSIPFYGSYNIYQLSHLARYLARLHVFSLSLPSETVERFKLPPAFNIFVANMFMGLAPKCVQMEPSLKDAYMKIKHLMEKTEYSDYLQNDLHKELGMQPVLVHSELWTNNIIFETDSEGQMLNDPRAIVDWQTVHAGSVGEDFATIMIFTDGVLRREAEMTLFDVYYDELVEELAKRGIRNNFNRKQIITAYRRCFVSQTLLLLWIIPLLMGGIKPPESEERLWDAREKALLLRAKMALEDAVEIYEKELVEQWATSRSK